MNDIVLIIISIVGIFISLFVLYSMPKDFLKEFEKSCHETIKKRDKELEEKEKFNKKLKKIFLIK